MLDLCCLSLLVPDFFVPSFHYLFDLALFLLKLLLVDDLVIHSYRC